MAKRPCGFCNGTIDDSINGVSTHHQDCILMEAHKAARRTRKANDPVNHPKHYTSHPSGIECIEITRHMNFNLGNATKYIWRAGLKHDAIEDLEKARWYIEDEIKKRKGEVNEQERLQKQERERAHVRGE